MKRLIFLFITGFLFFVYFIWWLSPTKHQKEILDNAVFNKSVITPYSTLYQFEVITASRVLYKEGFMLIDNKTNTIKISFKPNYRYIKEETLFFNLDSTNKTDLKFLSNIK